MMLQRDKMMRCLQAMESGIDVTEWPDIWSVESRLLDLGWRGQTDEEYVQRVGGCKACQKLLAKGVTTGCGLDEHRELQEAQNGRESQQRRFEHEARQALEQGATRLACTDGTLTYCAECGAWGLPVKLKGHECKRPQLVNAKGELIDRQWRFRGLGVEVELTHGWAALDLSDKYKLLPPEEERAPATSQDGPVDTQPMDSPVESCEVATLWHQRVLRYESDDEWLEARRSWLGASDAYSIADGGRYAYTDSGPMAVWESKLWGSSESSDNASMRRGHRHEAASFGILSEYGIEGEHWDRAVIQHPTAPMACSPDGVATYQGQAVGVEVKTVSPRYLRYLPESPYQTVTPVSEVEFDADDTLFMRWVWQVTHSMACSGAPGWLLVVDGWDEDPRVFYFERDEDDCAEAVRQAEEFWQYVESETPPPVSVHDTGAWRVLRDRLSQDGDKSVCPLGQDELDLVGTYTQAKAASKEAAATKDFCRARIRRAIGEHTHGRLPDGRLVYFDRNGSVRTRKESR